MPWTSLGGNPSESEIQSSRWLVLDTGPSECGQLGDLLKCSYSDSTQPVTIRAFMLATTSPCTYDPFHLARRSASPRGNLGR